MASGCEYRVATDGVGAEEQSAVGKAKKPWKLLVPLLGGLNLAVKAFRKGRDEADTISEGATFMPSRNGVSLNIDDISKCVMQCALLAGRRATSRTSHRLRRNLAIIRGFNRVLERLEDSISLV